MRLLLLEVARNAEIDQVNMPRWCHHDIGGLEISENDLGLVGMQVIQNVAQFNADTHHLVDGEPFAWSGIQGCL